MGDEDNGYDVGDDDGLLEMMVLAMMMSSFEFNSSMNIDTNRSTSSQLK